MFVPYETLPPTAKVWVYMTASALSSAEHDQVNLTLQNFCENWEAHHEPLQASFCVIDRHFIVLAVDEAVCTASGCSIDKSTALMRSLGEALQRDFFNRLLVGYRHNGITYVVNPTQLKTAIATGVVGADTPCFNSTAQTKAALTPYWQPLAATWAKKYLTMIGA